MEAPSDQVVVLLERKIEEVERDIKRVEEEIADVVRRLKPLEKTPLHDRNDKQEKEIDRLSKKEEQLRSEKEQLRKEKEQLREKENKLLDQRSGKSIVLDGFPGLGVPEVSSAPSSTKTKHGDAKWEVGDFGMISDSCLPHSPRVPRNSLLWTLLIGTGVDRLRLVNERSIANCVYNQLVDVFYEFRLEEKLQVVEELGNLRVRPDLLTLEVFAKRAVGSVEVKRPATGTNDDPFLSDSVFGEVFDQLMYLREYHGMEHPFGLLSTYEKVCVCWLPESSKVAAAIPDYIVEDSQDLPSTPKHGQKNVGENRSSPPGSTPSKKLVVKGRKIEDETEEGEEMPLQIERQIFVSPLFELEDSKNTLRVLASWALKLANASVSRIDLSGPFPSTRSFYCLSDRSCFWSSNGPKKLVFDKFPRLESLKNVYLIEMLGKGGTGYAWLACSSGGAVFCVKFCNDKKDPTKSTEERKTDQWVALEKECEMWKSVYPEHEKRVQVRILDNRPCLIMPYFLSIQRNSVEEIDKAIGLVRKLLEERFCTKGFRHNDVRWCNLGLSIGEEAILFDLESVAKNCSDNSWVDNCVEQLQQEARAHVSRCKN